MAVKFVVLALLNEGPLHGYAVHALIEERLGDFWELNYGQIYQVLTGLEKQGLVMASEVQVGRRPWRRVYALSANGREVLGQWLRTGTRRVRSFRDEFYLRLFFASATCPSELGRLVDEELERARGSLGELRLRRECATRQQDGMSDLVRRLFLDAAVLHAEAAVRSLEIGATAFSGGPEPSPTAGSRRVVGRQELGKRP